ncbi:MAG: sugar transferase [Candidatus Marinimicrobia bacterium]|nr:sugar transferase [Candidatus Neomarinimicrobiota bacterium]
MFIFGSGVTAWWILANYYRGPVLGLSESLPLVAFFWAVISFFSLLIGLYRQAFFARSNYHYLLAAKSYVYSTAMILASFYLLKLTYIPRSFIALYLLLLPMHFLVGRAILQWMAGMFSRIGLGIYNSLIVPNGSTGNSIISKFKWFPEFGYFIKGFLVHDGNGRGPDDLTTDGGLPTYPFQDLERVIIEQDIDRIFIPSNSFVVNGFHELIETCQRHRVKLRVVSPEATSLLRMARVYDIAGITLSAPPHHKLNFLKAVIKRGFDLVGAILILVLLSPVLFLASLAIWLESGRPIFYGQTRAAIKGGRGFKFYKFRSMVKTDPEERNRLLKLEKTTGLFKIKKDPRVTRVGRILRKFSIDELPQLFNVIRGEMSLVGPRPIMNEDFELMQMSDDFWDAIQDRARVKPGMTGLWQISGRSDVEFKEMVLLDLYYVEHNSLLFDLEILFETIPAVLFSRGAY